MKRQKETLVEIFGLVRSPPFLPSLFMLNPGFVCHLKSIPLMSCNIHCELPSGKFRLQYVFDLIFIASFHGEPVD